MASNFEIFESQQINLLTKSTILTALLFFLLCGLFFAISKAHLAAYQPIPNNAPVLEAELVERKEAPKLYEAKPQAQKEIRHEVSVSQKLNQGKESQNEMKQVMEQKNQTVAGEPPLVPTHGPLVDFSPAPKLPSYLKDQNLKTSILIEFLVSAEGKASPNLIGTSGNEELDALALKTAKSWIFRPASKDGQPIESRVRLRINFEVN